MVQFNSKLRMIPALILASSLIVGCSDRGFKTKSQTAGPAKTTMEEDLSNQKQEGLVESGELEENVSELLEKVDFLEQSEIIADPTSLIEAVVVAQFLETEVWKDVAFKVQVAVVSRGAEGRQFDFVTFDVLLNAFSEDEIILVPQVVNLPNDQPALLTLEADKAMMDINLTLSDLNKNQLYSVKYQTQAAGLVMVEAVNTSEVAESYFDKKISTTENSLEDITAVGLEVVE